MHKHRQSTRQSGIFSPMRLRVRIGVSNLSQFRYLLGMGCQVCSLGMRHFRCLDHSSVVSQGCRWSVIEIMSRGYVRADVVLVFPVGIIAITEWSRFGRFGRVSCQVSCFGVRHFRRVDHPSVVSQGRWWTVVRRSIDFVAWQGGCWEDETRERKLKRETKKWKLVWIWYLIQDVFRFTFILHSFS